jgi:hypothetical protein
MDKTKTTIYSVVYTCINADDFQNPHITVKTFLTQEKAEKYIKKDYESTLKLETAESLLDIVDHKNYGHHAYIKMGIGEDDINSAVECIFLWRIHTNNV